MTWLNCIGRCGQKVRSVNGNICRECWARVPQPLRHEWHRATQIFGSFERNKRVIQADIQRWVRENPAPPRENEVPLWRRHRQL